jgi:hypothetical protein
MGPVSKHFKTQLIRREGRRFVELPNDVFLEGSEISLMQDSDGMIIIHPAEEAPREAMEVRFSLSTIWEDEKWPVETPVWDEERLAYVPPPRS